MRARDPAESHRASTPLELFFDLCFVVAVAFAASRLHHALGEGHISDGLLGYATVFFAIWWAWVNVSWFASAYDNDDVPYRLLTFLQIGAVLILAAGVPRAFDAGDFLVVTIGYVLLRIVLVVQWLRASRSDPVRRPATVRYAAGVSLCQLGWVLLLIVPEGWYLYGFPLMVLAELSVPVWAESSTRTPWHPQHIAERYSLFTLIVLGESVAAAAGAIQASFDVGDLSFDLAVVAVSGLIIVFSMWWVYFDQPAHDLLISTRIAIRWGYGHLVIFAAAAAVGVGLQIAVDEISGAAHLSSLASGATIAVPIALYLISVWWLQVAPHGGGLLNTALLPGTALLILLTALTSYTLPLIALLMAIMIILFIQSAPQRRHTEYSG